jgi:cytochrome c oxidase assembly protein subunit 15
MSSTAVSISIEVPRGRTAPVALHRFAQFTCASTLFLLFAGALVKSTGSGLAVPDWPLSYGQVMPPMVGGVFYEHGHRMVATFVGMLTTLLACWMVHSEPRTWVRRLGLVALAAVICQGLLGGLTVLLKLPPEVSIAHAGLAQVFFGLTIALSFFTAPSWQRAPALAAAVPAPVRAVRRLAIGTALLVYVQILLGALVRHYGAGLSIPDFPLANGRIIPVIDSFYVGIHFAHRVGALLVTCAVVYLTVRVQRSWRARTALWWCATLMQVAVAVQIALGAYVIWHERAVEMTSMHLVNGAVTWGLALSLVLIAFRDLPGNEAAE